MVTLKHTFEKGYFEEEDRGGCHIPAERKKIWAVELDLLYEFDRVCKKLNIRYFLAYGSLIGALRDGHFIPWDDDIDVVMLREDYDILLQKGGSEFEPPYFLQSGYSDAGYFRGHAQLRNSATCGALPNELHTVTFDQGIFLDIFPMDYVNRAALPQLYKKKKRIFKMRHIFLNTDQGNAVKRIGKRIYKALFLRKYKNITDLYRLYDETFRNQQPSDVIEILMYYKSPSELHPVKKEWFADTVPVKFEDGIFPAPVGYDQFMKRQYGEDYMTPKQLPDDHSRFGALIYDVDRSYEEVKKQYRDIGTD